MKRKLLILSVLAICIAIVAAGTLAYFTADDTAHNVITSGSVEIALNEWADEAKQTPFEDLEGIMPGMTVTKIAEVTNTGASDAWVRVLITKDILPAGDVEVDPDMVQLSLNTTDWTLGTDGYYYYNKALAPGETTAPILTAVTFEPTMGNEYQNATATVDVSAQAVQTANNGTTAQTAAGWPSVSPTQP